ncbi:cellulase family glycosylhydrolase [Streptomyces sp. NPDC007851]|uniref:glycoside hydrolase family 5 protein n=1 Tax=Streptomyces sp. NPDC007851 TaxID=3155008 RepID=UPI0033E23429
MRLGPVTNERSAQYTATWQQIAATFRDEPRRLLFESINEPFFTGSSGDQQNAVPMNELNKTFHSVVRATGGGNADRLLVMPTLGDTPDQPKIDTLLATFAALDDPNLVASVHYFGCFCPSRACTSSSVPPESTTLLAIACRHIRAGARDRPARTATRTAPRSPPHPPAPPTAGGTV